eukprot:765988-Hanusia_phi.AAC.12
MMLCHACRSRKDRQSINEVDDQCRISIPLLLACLALSVRCAETASQAVVQNRQYYNCFHQIRGDVKYSSQKHDFGECNGSQGGADTLYHFLSTEERYSFLVNNVATGMPASIGVLVVSGASSPIMSQVCYISPLLIEQNFKIQTIGSEICISLNQSFILVPTAYLNTTNDPILTEASPFLTMLREFPLCHTRYCIDIQVLRYDAWGNNVSDDFFVDVIQPKLGGITYAEDYNTSLGPDEWTLYTVQNETLVKGNTVCKTFVCQLTRVVLPTKSFKTWMMVDLNGSPIARGSPFFVQVNPGKLSNFAVDPCYVEGKVLPGKSLFRFFAVDSFSNKIECAQDNSCSRLIAYEASYILVGHTKCFEDNHILAPVTIDLQSLRFSLDTNCTRAGCTQCAVCKYYNRTAVLGILQTTKAGVCLIEFLYHGKVVVLPSNFSQYFFLSRPPAGYLMYTIHGDVPNASTTSLVEYNANHTHVTLKGIATQNRTIDSEILLRDQYGNSLFFDQNLFETSIRSAQNIDGVVVDILPNLSYKTYRLFCTITRSGWYMLDIRLLGSFRYIQGSPYNLSIAPGSPDIANTILLSYANSTVNGSYEICYFQARDTFGNYVPSSDPFFSASNYPGTSSSNGAPGFWIWAVYLDSKNPIISLDSSGSNILKCPESCNREDPGFGSFKAGYVPTKIGNYYIEFQFCDPRTHSSANSCDKSTYNLSNLQPPEPPNFCTDIPAGEVGGARSKFACAIKGMNFKFTSVPGKVIVQNSKIFSSSTLFVGARNTIFINATYASQQTQCEYLIESFDIEQGICSFDSFNSVLFIPFHPKITGNYTLLVHLDGNLIPNSPFQLSVVTSYNLYNGTFSVALGRGISYAEVGIENTFTLYLRDHFGNLIPPEIEIPQQGLPFYKECGYPYKVLPTGEPTSGYGLSTCKLAFHTYILNSSLVPIRHIQGFSVYEIRPQNDGGILVKYGAQETGLTLMYIRYIPSAEAGFILHNQSGYLSLGSMNQSREGQIHGSPFQILLSPGSSHHAIPGGPGLQGGVVEAASENYVSVKVFDAFNNYVPCDAQEIDIFIQDSNGLPTVIEFVTSSNIGMFEFSCNIFFKPVYVGKYQLWMDYNQVSSMGSPVDFFVSLGLNPVSTSSSFANVRSQNTYWSCSRESDWTQMASIDSCHDMVFVGNPFWVQVSARDAFGRIPLDENVSFHVSVQSTAGSQLLQGYTKRMHRGEHELQVLITLSGNYYLSVDFEGVNVKFSAGNTKVKAISVNAGQISPEASSIVGAGLTLATAGKTSIFTIFPKDRFGNSVYNTFPPDQYSFLPGENIFQVYLQDMHSYQLVGRVKKMDGGNYISELDVSRSGMYNITVLLLDTFPSIPVSSLAVVRNSYFISMNENRSEFLAGTVVGSYLQPFLIRVQPGTACYGGSCSCYGAPSNGSTVKLGVLPGKPVTAGEAFPLLVYWRDACLNPTSAKGRRILIVADFFNENSNFSATSDQETISKLEVKLTKSGWYRINVYVEGTLLLPQNFEIEILPMTTAYPQSSFILSDVNLNMITTAGFSLVVQANDRYSNRVTVGMSSLDVRLIPIGEFYGQQGFVKSIQDHLDGRYSIMISNVRSAGLHVLNISMDGELISESPSIIEIYGGSIDPSKSSYVFRASPNIDSNASNSEMHLDKYMLFQTTVLQFCEILFVGLDSIGYPSRVGYENMQLEVSLSNHSSWRIPPKLNVPLWTDSRCVISNYGKFCNMTQSGGFQAGPVYVDIVRESDSTAYFDFELHNHSKCISSTGFDALYTVFDNYTIVNSTTGNLSSMEKSMDACMLKCIEYNCSCLTFIGNSGTYLDGKCILMTGPVFVQVQMQPFSNITQIAAAIPIHKIYQNWAFLAPKSPIRLKVRFDAVGLFTVRMFVNNAQVSQGLKEVYVNPRRVSTAHSRLIISDKRGNIACSGSLSAPEHNCTFLIAGERYCFEFNLMDSNNNNIALTFDLEKNLFSVCFFNVNCTNASLTLEAMSFVSCIPFFIAGPMKMFLIQGHQEFEDMNFSFIVVSSPVLYNSSKIQIGQESCTVICENAIVVPVDRYFNVMTTHFSFFIWDDDIRAFSAISQPVMTTLFFPLSTKHLFQCTRAGKYMVEVSAAQQAMLAGSPLFFFVEAGVLNISTSELSGPGLIGGYFNSLTLVEIYARDRYGNLVPCNHSLLTIKDERAQHLLINPIASFHLRCSVLFKIQWNSSSRLTVRYQDYELSRINFTVFHNRTVYLSQNRSKIRCAIVADSLQVSTPCYAHQDTSVESGAVFILLGSLSDQLGLLPLIPNNSLHINMFQCDMLFYFHFDRCKVIRSSIFVVHTDVLGRFRFEYNLSTAVRHEFTLYGNGLSYKWNVIVHPTAFGNEFVLYGSGLERLAFNYKQTFSIENRDRFGNLRSSRAKTNPFDARIYFAGALVQSLVQELSECLGTTCVYNGRYLISFFIPLPAQCASQKIIACTLQNMSDAVNITVVYNQSFTIFSKLLSVLDEGFFFQPASFSLVHSLQKVDVFLAGESLQFHVIPENAAKQKLMMSYGHLQLDQHGFNLDESLKKCSNDACYVVELYVTVTGTYKLNVLDGAIPIRGSPLVFHVSAGRINTRTCQIFSDTILFTFDDMLNNASIYFLDTFGNKISDVSYVKSSLYVTSVTNSDIRQQIPSIPKPDFNAVLFSFKLPGRYVLKFSVNGDLVQYGTLYTGGFQVPFSSQGIDCQVLSRGISAPNSYASFASSFSFATAGLPFTFSITGRDHFNVTVDDMAFYTVTLEQGQCKVQSGLVSVWYCLSTRSGYFMLNILFNHIDIGGSPYEIFIQPGPISLSNSYLIQPQPKVYTKQVSGQIFSSKTSSQDGAFLKVVGSNSFTLLIQDQFSNTLDQKQIMEQCGNQLPTIFFTVRKQFSKIVNGALMTWNAANIVVTNGTVLLPTKSGSVYISNSSFFNCSQVPKTPQVDPSSTEIQNQQVSSSSNGTFILSFFASVAGKYRIEVFINGFRISKLVSVEDILSIQRGEIVIEDGCCFPLKPGINCPSSGDAGPVCGDVITVLPSIFNRSSSSITTDLLQADSLKTLSTNIFFDQPYLYIFSRDAFGNRLTYSNLELQIQILQMNGSIIFSSIAESLSPNPILQVCRQTDLDPSCGAHQYIWPSYSLSGTYKIEVLYQGLRVGAHEIFRTIRSGQPDLNKVQLFGPGMHVYTPGNMTYFYIRVYDSIWNLWEPDCCQDQNLSIAFSPPNFFGVGYPNQNPSPKLSLQYKALIPWTRLIYFGEGLFQVQFVPWPNTTGLVYFQVYFGSKRATFTLPNGNIQSFFTGSWFPQPPYTALVPSAENSFATGSALYTHFAGDTVDLYIHAMTSLSLTAGSFLPALSDDPRKTFVIKIRGPPGVSSRRIQPRRGGGYNPWQLHASWASTVSGIYTISVEYGGLPIKGNSTNLANPLEGSPWTVFVRCAPTEVNYTRIVGSGISFAQVGKLSTFTIQTRDIFDNPIDKMSYDRFRGNDRVNVSIVSTYGSPIFPQIVSLQDGSYRVEYSVNAGGNHRIFVMVNGILVQNTPYILQVQKFALDPSKTHAYVQFAQEAGQLCAYNIVTNQSLQTPCDILSGELIQLEIDVRDFSNQSVPISPEVQKSSFLQVLGSSFFQQVPFSLRTEWKDDPSGRMSASFVVTKSGLYSLHATVPALDFLSFRLQISVSPHDIAVENSFITGLPKECSVNESISAFLHCRDIFGNVCPFNNRVELRVLDSNGVVIVVSYTVHFFSNFSQVNFHIAIPGLYEISLLVPVGIQTSTLQTIPGSGFEIKVHEFAPLVTKAQFTSSGEKIEILFNTATNLACNPVSLNCLSLLNHELQGNRDCCDIFDNSTCKLFGSNPVCRFKSTIYLQVVMGMNSSVVPGAVLRLSNIKGMNILSDLLNAHVLVNADLKSFPYLFLAHPRIMNDVNDAVIEILQYSGGLGRKVTFSWTTRTLNVKLAAFLDQIPSNAMKIIIPGSFLSYGFNFFSVQATNRFNLSTVTTFNVMVGSKELIPIIFPEGNTKQVKVSEAVILHARFLAQNLSDLQIFSLGWTPINTSALNVSNIDLNSTTILIPPLSLVANQTYIFQFSVRGYRRDRMSIGAENLTVRTISQDIVVNLAGPYGDVIEGQAIVFDASATFDPDNAAGSMWFSWSCRPIISILDGTYFIPDRISPLPCFFDIGGILARNSSLVNLTGALAHRRYLCNECISGAFVIQVNVSKQARWTTANSTIFLKKKSYVGEFPRVDIIPPLANMLDPTKPNMISSFYHRENVNISSFEYEWSIVSSDCCIAKFLLSNPSSTLFPNTANGAFLILNPNLFGTDMQFSLRLTIINRKTSEELYSSFPIDFLNSPKCLEFSVLPTSGRFVSTSFDISCDYWINDYDDFPLQFLYQFVMGNLSKIYPIQDSIRSAAQVSFPLVLSQQHTVKVKLRVSDFYSVSQNYETVVTLNPVTPLVARDFVLTFNETLAARIASDLNLMHTDSAYSKLLFAVTALFQVLSTSQSKQDVPIASSVYSQLIYYVLELQKLLPAYPFGFHLLATSVQVATSSTAAAGVLSCTEFGEFIKVLSPLLTEKSIVAKNPYISRMIGHSLDNLVRNVLIKTQAALSIEMLNTCSLMMENLITLLDLLSIGILDGSIPQTEFFTIFTKGFVSNNRRMESQALSSYQLNATSSDAKANLFLVKGKTKSINSIVSDIYLVGITSIQFPSNFFRQGKFFDSCNGELIYGTFRYPKTLIDNGFPTSRIVVNQSSLYSKFFGAVPSSQATFNAITFVDVMMNQYFQNPYAVLERQQARVNWASSAKGRIYQLSCSSALHNCSSTHHLCTPPPYQGSQGPTFQDTSCSNAVDVGNSSWAVNPLEIPSPSGTGSFITIVFKENVQISMMQYRAREGPKYCKGTEGKACRESTINCTCIPGGDKSMLLRFSDGSEQTVELKNTYEWQTFYLEPVTSRSVTMTVTSVYSNSITCPLPSLCPWWEPTCNDWCPNGISGLKFISTVSFVTKYNYNFSYLTNYSMSLRLLSDVSQLIFRQEDRSLCLKFLRTPLLTKFYLSEAFSDAQPHTVVACKVWNSSLQRWSSEGTLNSGELQGNHVVCLNFLAGSFSLAEIQNPVRRMKNYFPGIAVYAVKQHTTQNLISFFSIIFCLLLMSFAFIVERVQKMNRWKKNEIDRHSAKYMRIEQGTQLAHKSSLLDRTFPIYGLMHSKILASKSCDSRAAYYLVQMKCWKRFHYLFSVVSNRDDLGIVERFLCFLCVFGTIFMCSAMAYSGLNVDGSYLPSLNLPVRRWYMSVVMIGVIIAPLSQFFPFLFRVFKAGATNRIDSLDSRPSIDVKEPNRVPTTEPQAHSEIDPVALNALEGESKQSDDDEGGLESAECIPLPMGPPARKFSKSQERRFLRKRKMKEFVAQGPRREAFLQKMLFRIFISRRDAKWKERNRSAGVFLASRSWSFLVYFFHMVWIALMMVATMTYTSGFDQDLAVTWLITSITNILVEFLVSQTIICMSISFFVNSAARTSLLDALMGWSLERADLLPPMG